MVCGESVLPDDEKMRELIVYISDRCETDETFGAVKLNKILFLADFNAFLNLGTPITGHEYMALKNGPVPRRLLPLHAQLLEEGSISLKERDFGGYRQKKTLALRPANLKLFSAEEIDLVDRIIENTRNKSGAELIEMFHAFLGWKLAIAEGERTSIPYSVGLVSDRAPSLDEIALGVEEFPEFVSESPSFSR